MNPYSFRKLLSSQPTDREEGGHVGGRSTTKEGEHGSGNGFDAGSGGAGNGFVEETPVADTRAGTQVAGSYAAEGVVPGSQASPPDVGGGKSHG